MSVERRGDNNFSTVQRRGEKKTVLPSRDYTQPKPEPVQEFGSTDTAPSRPTQDSARSLHSRTNDSYRVKIAGADFDAKNFEENVRKRIAHYEAHPEDKKAFLKKFDGWVGKAVFALILVIAIPPLAGIVVALGFFYFFLMTLKPKDPARAQRKQQIAEDVVVALKLKKVK